MTITLKPTASETTIQNNGSDIFTVDSTGIAMASGKTIQNASGDVVTNTPAFSAQLGTAQTLPNVTVTKAAFNNQLFDTDNAFDTSTNRFTVPTGKAGIYSISAHLRFTTSASNLNLAVLYLYKNNANTKLVYNNHNANGRGTADSLALTTLLDLNAGDYLEIFAYMGGGSTGSGLQLNTGTYTTFCAHKLIT